MKTIGENKGKLLIEISKEEISDLMLAINTASNYDRKEENWACLQEDIRLWEMLYDLKYNTIWKMK